jgi:hypothetical protein
LSFLPLCRIIRAGANIPDSSQVAPLRPFTAQSFHAGITKPN